MQKTLSQWLAYIETLHPNTMQLGLERITGIAQKMGVNAFNCPVISVAGTNGKGSCVAFLSSILQTAGYRVGAYTSPHLLHFKERIQINRADISDQELIQAFAQVEKARAQVPLTYFEITTLVALLLFKQACLDVVILEVGLGGRLDAVNCVESDVAIITSIALDHMDWLGDTREDIGKEKAGIFRAGKSAICGELQPPASIFSCAAAVNAPLLCVNRDFSYSQALDTWDWQIPQLMRLSALPIPQLPLQNAATALMGLYCLQERLPVTIEAIRQGLKAAFIPGRFQHFSQPCAIILDVAHNPASAHLLAQRLQLDTSSAKTLAVVSMLADKDIANTLAPLLSVVDDWYIAGLDVPRGSSPATISQHLQQLGVQSITQQASVLDAFKLAVKACGQKERIVVFGSFHTVEPVLNYLYSKHSARDARR